MCADAFKKSSRWLLCLNHWSHHTKRTWKPTVHTRKFHILVIMKDSSVHRAQEVSPVPSSTPFPNNQTRDPVLSHLFKVNISVSIKYLSPNVERQSKEKHPRQTWPRIIFRLALPLLVSLLLKPQFHSLEGTGRYCTGSQDAMATSSSSLEDIYKGRCLHCSAAFLIHTSARLNFQVIASRGTPLIRTLFMFLCIHKDKCNFRN